MTNGRWLALAAAFAVATATPAAGQDRKEKEKADKARQAEIQALLPLVDEVASGKPAPTGHTLKWEGQHFIRGQNDATYVPFTVAVEGATPPAGAVGFYIRVAKKGEAVVPPPAPGAKKEKDGDKASARSPYPFEDVYFFDVPAAASGQSQRIQRAFIAPPGEYEVFIAVRDRAVPGGATPPRAGVLRHELTVPSFTAGDLTTSSVILCKDIEQLQAPLPMDRQAENPYTIGMLKIIPAETATLSKKGNLTALFWVYGAGMSDAKKPDVEVNYAFHRKTTEGETFFNRTEAQKFNAETLPPTFDMAAGHQVFGFVEVPLASFAEGDYRLEVKVADKIGGKTVDRNLTFSVGP